MNPELVVLVPDKDIEQVVRGVLARPQSLNIRTVDYELLVHINRDPGCCKTGDQLLAMYASDPSRHALVLFDWAWEGRPTDDVGQLAMQVEDRLGAHWGDRARCIVIYPEVESWVWSDSPHVASALGWEGRSSDLRAWLDQQGLWPRNETKPPDPKRAFRMALAVARVPPSSAVFRRVADTVSLKGCTDASFRGLVATLQAWFPRPPTTPA